MPKNSKRTVDITGQKFAHLTAVRPTGDMDAQGYAKWKCLCDCGQTFVASSGNLKKGVSKWCRGLACPFGPGPVGRKIGRLSVIARIEGIAPSTYLCVCDCGNITQVRGCNLKGGNGDVRSCGCLKRDIIQERCTKHELTRVRQKLGLTAADVGKKLRVSPQMVGSVERQISTFRRARAGAALLYQDARVESPHAKRFVKCDACGQLVEKYVNQIARSETHFCDHGCHVAFQRGQHPPEFVDNRPPEMRFEEKRVERQLKPETVAIAELIKSTKK